MAEIVFPARAGVIPIAIAGDAAGSGLSRTSGGDPTVDADKAAILLSFPHERG